MNELDSPLYTQCREKEVAEFIAQKIAKELNKEPSGIDIHAPFQDFGLESIFYLELIGDLAEWQEVDIPETIFFEETCILGAATRLKTYIEKRNDKLDDLDHWQPIALKHGLHAKELSILRAYSSDLAKGQKSQAYLTLQANKVADSIPIFWFYPTTRMEAITQATPDRSTSCHLLAGPASIIANDSLKRWPDTILRRSHALTLAQPSNLGAFAAVLKSHWKPQDF